MTADLVHRVAVPDIRARELLTVVALAECGSFVAAAAQLKTSQPALTRTVKRLERILGVMLFARSTRHVEITAAGREFVAVAERMLHDIELIVQNMSDVTTEQRGRVTLSTYSAYAANPLPSLIKRYRATRPLIEMRIREGRQAEIVEDVRSGAADFGIGYINTLPDIFDSVALRKEPVYVVVPGTHALARKKRSTIALSELRHEALVAPPSDTFLRRLTDGAASSAGFALHYGVTVDRMLSVMYQVCAGVGIGILPKNCLPDTQRGEGFHAALLTEPALSVSVGIILLRGRHLTPAAAGMVSLIKEHGGGRKRRG